MEKSRRSWELDLEAAEHYLGAIDNAMQRRRDEGNEVAVQRIHDTQRVAQQSKVDKIRRILGK